MFANKLYDLDAKPFVVNGDDIFVISLSKRWYKTIMIIITETYAHSIRNIRNVLIHRHDWFKQKNDEIFRLLALYTHRSWICGLNNYNVLKAANVCNE